jgi:dTDP-4-amino-4,6-dideoxygalactose transaminase
VAYGVPFIRPVFPSATMLSADLAEIVDANWYTNFGPKERKFASSIAAYIGEGYHAATFANATIALIAAISTILGRGDGLRYIIVPSFTFAAGPEAIEWCGYRPLFVDIESSSVQPSLSRVREALRDFSGELAAILLSNTFGIGNPDIDDWEEFARGLGIPLVIDSAAGFGSMYGDGARVGTAGTCEIFSFHATKPFAIGEGGAVVTRDPDLTARLMEFTNFGFRDGMGAVALGINGKLQEISAAVGLRQLETFGEALESRRSVLRYYMGELASAVEFPLAIEDSSVCFATMLLPSKNTRDRARTALQRRDVEARTYYSPPVHRQPHFAHAAQLGDLAITDSVVDRVLSVPVYQDMSLVHMQMIVDTLLSIGKAP